MTRIPKMLLMGLVAGSALCVERKVARILNGNIAPSESFPYVVFLVCYKLDAEGVCGGSLITMNTVLTAAHCVANFHPGNCFVVAGEKHMHWYLNLKRINPGETLDGRKEDFQERRVQHVTTHEEYQHNDTYILNDIALVTVQTPFKQSSRLSTARLAPGVANTSMNCSVVGWGLHSNNKTDFKQYYLSNVVTRPSHSCPPLTDKTFVCFVDHTSIRGISSGDSGGPLVCGMCVRGIISHTDETGKWQYFVALDFYLKWINDKLHAEVDSVNTKMKVAVATILLGVCFALAYCCYQLACKNRVTGQRTTEEQVCCLVNKFNWG